MKLAEAMAATGVELVKKKRLLFSALCQLWWHC
jgi:hypothetical protein